MSKRKAPLAASWVDEAETVSFGEGLSIVQIIEFFDRYWLLLIGFSTVAALLMALYALFLAPPVFSSSATFLVVPARVESELRPETLSVHAYRALLESDAVLAELQQRLLQAEVLDREEEVRLGDDFATRLFVSRRQEATSLAPMFEAVTRADTPQKAAEMARVWAEVFLERVREVVLLSTNAEVDFVEEQYPKTREELTKLEDDWLTLSKEYERRFQETATTGDRRLAAYNKKTAEKRASNRAESRSLMDAFLSSWLAEFLSGNTTENGETLRQRILGLGSLRAQLAQTPPFVVLETSIPDEAIWEALMSADTLSADVTKKLVNQEINPIHQELARQAIEAEGELMKSGDGLRPELTRLVASLEQLQLERSTLLAKLEEDRALGLMELRRQRELDLDAIDRERTVRLRQLQRDLNQLGEVERELRRDYSEAILAKAQAGRETVYLTAPPPVVPVQERRRVSAKASIAAILGAMLGGVFAVVREVHGRSRGKPAEKQEGLQGPERLSI